MPASSDAPSDTLLGTRAAVLLVGAFLLLLAGVTAFSLWDAPRRSQLERFSQDTAVGDTHYFKVPFPPPATPSPVLTWEGKPMAPVNYEKVKIDDTAMRPVFHDEKSGLTIYRRADKETAGPFIKIGVSEYLQIKANGI